jgi:putative ABC transport system ATP-binding protein
MTTPWPAEVTSALLQARAVEKAYGHTQALRGVDLAVHAGEIVAVTGPSGSGKSTLLYCLAGILRPEAGSVTYAGLDLGVLSEAARTRLRRREFGVVLQFGQLVPELTAMQNVMLPLLLEGHNRRSASTAARSWLDLLGMGDACGSLPGELSGGQAQRVAVARALVTGPRVVFADEPTGSLDSVSGQQVLEVMLGTARAHGTTVLVITHDNVVAAHCDREIVLRDGRVETAAVPQ